MDHYVWTKYEVRNYIVIIFIINAFTSSFHNIPVFHTGVCSFSNLLFEIRAWLMHPHANIYWPEVRHWCWCIVGCISNIQLITIGIALPISQYPVGMHSGICFTKKMCCRCSAFTLTMSLMLTISVSIFQLTWCAWFSTGNSISQFMLHSIITQQPHHSPAKMVPMQWPETIYVDMSIECTIFRIYYSVNARYLSKFVWSLHVARHIQNCFVILRFMVWESSLKILIMLFYSIL